MTANHFNSHAHEGRDSTTIKHTETDKNFNSHAHEGRDGKVNNSQSVSVISTHTPTRGVTNTQVIYCGVGVFQLTRPRGA